MKFRIKAISVLLTCMMILSSVPVGAEDSLVVPSSESTETRAGDSGSGESGSESGSGENGESESGTSEGGAVEDTPEKGSDENSGQEDRNEDEKKKKRADRSDEIIYVEDAEIIEDVSDETDLYYDENSGEETEEAVTDEEAEDAENSVSDDEEFFEDDGEVDEYSRKEDPDYYKRHHVPEKELIKLNKNFEEDFSHYEEMLEENPDPFINPLTGYKYSYPKYFKASRPKVRYGMDISKYQGVITVANWKLLKNKYGVDFAFIRAGYRGYGSSGSINVDNCFSSNVVNASKAGVEVGVYYFSQAISTKEAVEEAEHCISIIGGNKDLITLPVVIDYEYAGDLGRLRGAHLSDAQHTEIVNAFCERVGEAGFLPGIYANKSMLLDDMILNNIPDSNYIWMANFTDKDAEVKETTYSGRLDSWQFTSSFSGFGEKGLKVMLSDTLDLDFWFGPFPSEVNNRSLSFDANGGLGSIDSLKGDAGDKVVVPDCTFTREGCRFRQWNTESDGSGTPYMPGYEFELAESDETLYAIWDCTVTFDADGTVTTKETGADELIEEPAAPVKENFDFEGWFKDDSFTDPWDFSADRVKSDMTLYALFTPTMPDPEHYDELFVNGITNRYYTGSAITFDDLEVVCGGRVLSEGKDYTVKYSNNKNVGLAKIAINGKGNYSGSYRGEFAILPIDLTGHAITKDISLAYTGKVQKGTTSAAYMLEDGSSVILKAGTDFTYTYPRTEKNKDDYDPAAFVGSADNDSTYTVTINGKGNYKGTATFTETILKEDSALIPVAYLQIDKIGPQKLSYSPAGKIIPAKPVPVIKYNGAVIDNSDNEYFDLEYINNDEPGTASVYITGKGAYTGSRRIDYRISALSIGGAEVTGLDAGAVYTSGEVTDDAITLTYGATKDSEGTVLVKDRDYTVSYSNNVNAGNATVTLTGTGIYSGTIRRKLAIRPAKLAIDGAQNPEIHVYMNGRVPFAKGGAKPGIEIVYKKDGKNYRLRENKDFTLSYKNNKKPAESGSKKMPCVYISGRGNFTGKLAATFSIVPADIALLEMTVSDVIFANRANICRPAIKIYDTNKKRLTAGVDFDRIVSYTYVKEGVTYPVEKTDVLSAGTVVTATVTGKGNYIGTISKTFRFVQKSISSARVRVKNMPYTGSRVTLKKEDISEIKIGRDVLTADDFDIVPGTYINNKNSGTAKVTIKGKGDYGGTKVISFRIVKPVFGKKT